MKYFIYIHGDEFATIEGVVAAYAAWKHAVALADLCGYTADLVDGENGEVVETNWDEDE